MITLSRGKALWTIAGIVFFVLAVLAFIWAGSVQTTILQAISCPVYQAPATPDPTWPIACGGQQAVNFANPNVWAFAPSVAFAVLGLASLRHAWRLPDSGVR